VWGGGGGGEGGGGIRGGGVFVEEDMGLIRRANSGEASSWIRKKKGSAFFIDLLGVTRVQCTINYLKKKKFLDSLAAGGNFIRQ